MAKCGATVTTGAIIGSPSITPLFGETSTETWAAGVTLIQGSGSTSPRLSFDVTGEAGKTIKWHSSIYSLKQIGV